jgi:hypothetical protein
MAWDMDPFSYVGLKDNSTLLENLAHFFLTKSKIGFDDSSFKMLQLQVELLQLLEFWILASCSP